MDTIVSLRRGIRGSVGNAEYAYKITVFSIQDYRVVRAELQDGFFAAGQEKRRHRRQRQRASAGFRSELASLLDERDANYCFFGQNRTNERLSREILPLPEFEGYLEQDWVQRMLPCAVYPDFVVLGTVPYLQELLCGLAPRMKSLLWILPERSYAERQEDFAEDFYQEYGLAVDIRSPGIQESYGRLQVEKRLKEPVSILDFVQDGHIPGLKPAPGSVWLDLAAVEEKERRIEARRLGAVYFSLKKQWEEPQKLPYLLDTLPKNRYNT